MPILTRSARPAQRRNSFKTSINLTVTKNLNGFLFLGVKPRANRGQSKMHSYPFIHSGLTFGVLFLNHWPQQYYTLELYFVQNHERPVAAVKTETENITAIEWYWIDRSIYK